MSSLMHIFVDSGVRTVSMIWLAEKTHHMTHRQHSCPVSIGVILRLRYGPEGGIFQYVENEVLLFIFSLILKLLTKYQGFTLANYS